MPSSTSLFAARVVRGFLLACGGCVAAFATEVMSWDEAVVAMRAGTYPGYAVFIGRQHAAFIEAVRASKIDTAGVPLVVLSANAEVMNPYSDRRVPGARLILNLTGPVNDLTGGTLLFFDRDGIMVPELTAIQNFHKCRPEVLELYAKLLISPVRGKVSIAEFARLENIPIGVTLAMEVQAGRHKDFTWIYEEVDLAKPFVRGVGSDGAVLDPLRDTAIHVITADPSGEVFIAQVRELWEKLSVPNGPGQFHRPPLVIYGPAGAAYPALDALKIAYKAAALTREQLGGMKTPMIVLPGGPDKKATIIHGFLPGQVVGAYILPKDIQGLITNEALLNPDIAIGDVDVVAAASEGGK